MEINGVPIEDTFAEAFSMHMNRTIITAYQEDWARITALEATGLATSHLKKKSLNNSSLRELGSAFSPAPLLVPMTLPLNQKSTILSENNWVCLVMGIK